MKQALVYSVHFCNEIKSVSSCRIHHGGQDGADSLGAEIVLEMGHPAWKLNKQSVQRMACDIAGPSLAFFNTYSRHVGLTSAMLSEVLTSCCRASLLAGDVLLFYAVM